jgi:hypothetical protein
MNHIQQETFQGEIDDLLHGKSVKKDSRLASLNPVLHNGLLRVKGRLDLPLEKCPIILPNSHHVTTLIIRSCHERNGHTGMLQVLSSLREKFWILKVPSTVRKVLGHVQYVNDIKDLFVVNRWHQLLKIKSHLTGHRLHMLESTTSVHSM